jgi:hypothetical protein
MPLIRMPFPFLALGSCVQYKARTIGDIMQLFNGIDGTKPNFLLHS